MSGITSSWPQLAVFGLSALEIGMVLLVVVMLFGVGKLPIVAKQLGAGVRNFQRSVRGDDEDEANAAKPAEPKKLEDKSQDNTSVAQSEGSKSNAW